MLARLDQYIAKTHYTKSRRSVLVCLGAHLGLLVTSIHEDEIMTRKAAPRKYLDQSVLIFHA